MEKKSKIKHIRRINKSIVNGDGTVDSFDRQLIHLIGGVYDTAYPMVVSENTACVDYVGDLNKDYPLIMNVSTVDKIKERHNLGYVFVSDCEEMLKNSVLAFDSLKFKSSKIFLLDKLSDKNDPIIAICRIEKTVGVTHVNEITSIYDRCNFENFLQRVYDANLTFYKNKKTEQYFKSHWSRLPDDLKYALSCNYSNITFTKSQVENILNSKYSDKPVSTECNLSLEQQIAKAEKLRNSAGYGYTSENIKKNEKEFVL